MLGSWTYFSESMIGVFHKKVWLVKEKISLSVKKVI